MGRMNDGGGILGSPRQWATDLAIATGIGVFLGVIGPFGSFNGGGLEYRLFFWVANLWIGLIMLSLVMRVSLRAASRLDLPIWFALPVCAAIGAVPLTLLVALFSANYWPGNHGRMGSLLQAYGQVLAIAGGAAHIAWLTFRRAPVDAMQWMSLGLVVVFGGASLATHDPRFIMLKPTLIYAAIGSVMLRRGWMSRYIPEVALAWSADVTTAFGYAWAGLMFATGAANLYLAVHGDPKAWAWFLGVFPLASKLALFAVQYLTTRFIVVSRKRAVRGRVLGSAAVADMA